MPELVSLPASGIRKVFDAAVQLEKEGHQVLHLEIGRPDWHLSPGAESEIVQAVVAGKHQYTANRGLPTLRQLISKSLKELHNVPFNADSEIIVTCGASEALSVSLLAILQPGEEVIIPEPAWSHYRAVTLMAKGTPVSHPTRLEEGFQLDLDRLEKQIHSKTRVIILNSPQNPTGAVQSIETLQGLARISEKFGVYIFNDAIYKDFSYGASCPSILPFMEDASKLIHVDSFSKSYAMTGWRIGFIAANAELSDRLNRVHQYLTVCAPSLCQMGAVGVLSSPRLNHYLQEMRSAFDKRRSIWEQALASEDKISFSKPKGAFYLFPKVNGQSGTHFAHHLLNKYKVAVVPGEVFGKGYEEYFRISYGGEEKVQVEAARRLSQALNESFQ